MSAIEASTAWNRITHCNFFESLIKPYLFFCFLLGSPKIENLTAYSIEPENHNHDDVDNNYTLSSKTE